MLFNSYEFIFLFLPLTLAGFFFIGQRSHHLAALWLGMTSLAFYGWWNALYVLLLLASIAANYGMGYAIGRGVEASRGRLLAIGIAANLALLGYFKYADFFLSSVNAVVGTRWSLLNVVLPLGISFFTFTQIAFLVDVRRGVAHEYRFVHYLLFVTYFPHLIAGPVLHHKQMMPQFQNRAIYRPQEACIATGLTVFVIGLAKKVLLADNLGEYATPFFEDARLGLDPGALQAWTGAIAYTLQLYFDFSGYSDMAIGLSLLFGIRLPINFDSPYRAVNIIDFWRRWHMTLSAFLRDYLYIPLGGNRLGAGRRYVNLLTTMVLGGLWHGANWTFVVWGALHGVFLAINHLWQARFADVFGRLPGGRPAAQGLTFLAVVIAWVFFRADNLTTALRIVGGMFGEHGSVGQMAPIREQMAYWCLGGLAIAWLAPNSQQLADGLRAHAGTGRIRQLATHPLWLGGLLALSLSRLSEKSEFLYFQF